jgi:hypothetical protein
MKEIILSVVSVVLMLAGLVGIVLPFLPGIHLVWLGFFIYASVTGFETISLLVTMVFLGLTLALTLLDVLAPLWGAKKYRASKWGILGAFLGTIIGVFIFNVLGVIIGPFLGALAGELLAGKDRKQAFQSALGAFVGFLAGTLVKLALALAMFGFFIFSFF